MYIFLNKYINIKFRYNIVKMGMYCGVSGGKQKWVNMVVKMVLKEIEKHTM